MRDISISIQTRQAWDKWLSVANGRVHPYYNINGIQLKDHISISLNTAIRTVNRILHGFEKYKPKLVLEVGCSIGFKCLALSQLLPGVTIVGIEPDMDALKVGIAMAKEFRYEKIHLIGGKGEHLPFSSETFDLIVCHTTIEHVENVDDCLGEMARVLKAGGALHIEAPNYLWPLEPHLGIVVPPLCPKFIMRFLAKVQGAGEKASYVNHLKLVHPVMIERLLKENGLRYQNRMYDKIISIFKGEMNEVTSYKRLARALMMIHKIGYERFIARLLVASRFYPSLFYTAYKPTEHK